MDCCTDTDLFVSTFNFGLKKFWISIYKMLNPFIEARLINRLESSCHSLGDRVHVAMHGRWVFCRTIVFLTQVKFKKLESNAFITSTSVSSTRAELFSNRSFVVCLIFHILTFSLDSTTMYSFTLQIFFTYIFCSPCVTLSISEGQLSFWRQIFDKVDVTSCSISRILIDRHLKPSVQSGHRRHFKEQHVLNSESKYSVYQ